MRTRSSRPVLKFLLLLVLGSSTLLCRGYTYLQIGVDSNFLIDGGRVLFAQSDGSLTALSLETGDVLVRDRSRNFSGTLRRVPEGLLLLNDRTIALLNPTNFSVWWETPFHFEPNIAGDALVSCDETGAVQCRSLSDGRVRWSYQLPGALEITAESGKVLVHRAATYEEGSVPMTALLDALTGKEFFRKTPTNGVHWAATFFGGTNLYVVTGAFKEKRSEYEPERLAIWNTNGQETGSLPIPAEWRQAVRDGKPFELGGQTFWKGHVYPDRQSIPFESRGKLSATAEQTNRVAKTFESDYDLGDGVSFIERANYLGGTNGENTAFVMEIEVRTPTNQWRGVLPYLVDRGRITAIAKAGGKILIGTDIGQVECLKTDSGASLWLYVFPTLRRTMSYSSHGLPPTLSEAAANFRRENSNPPTSGLHVINGKARAPRLVSDPDPIEPYRDLRLRLAIAWSGAGLSIVILLLVHILGWARKWASSVPGAIAVWLTFLLFCGYMFYGRVSPESSLALRISILTGFVFGLWDAARSYRRGLWLEGTILIVTFAGIGLFIFLALV